MNEFDDSEDTALQQWYQMIRTNLRWQHLEGFIQVEFTEPSKDYLLARIRNTSQQDFLDEIEIAFNK